MRFTTVVSALTVAVVTCVGCQRDAAPFSPSGVLTTVDSLDGLQTAKKKANPSLTGSMPLRAADWANKGVPEPYPWRNDGSGALVADFPGEQGLFKYAYFLTGGRRSIAGRVTADISIITTSGQPAFHWDLTQPANCNTPPSVVLLLWSDKLSMKGEFDRWWAFADAKQLAPGEITISAPLDPSRWLSVFGVTGDQNPSAFAATVDNIGGVGMTFGGGCYLGHGVYVTGGTAKVAIRSLRIE